MNKITHTTLVFFLAAPMLLFSLALSGCFDSSSDDTPPPLRHQGDETAADGGTIANGVIGSSADGKIYFNYNCAICHAAGADDNSRAFTATDLAQKQDMIAADMSNYDTTTKLMTTMRNLPQKRVDDLKAYLKNL